MTAALEWLERRGVKTGIVSTKFRFRIESIPGAGGPVGNGGRDRGRRGCRAGEAGSAGLSAAVERLDVAPAALLYVGDSLTDAETARRAGVRFAAVLTGTTASEAFADHAVEGLLRTLDELPGLVEALGTGLAGS